MNLGHELTTCVITLLNPWSLFRVCTDWTVGAGDLSRALRQQLLATVISTASQIQMEKGSHSVAPLIMYGTDGAARLWTTGGPSHVPVEPSGYVLQITHVSPRFTKHLYIAPCSQRQKMPNLLLPFSVPEVIWLLRKEVTSRSNRTSVFAPPHHHHHRHHFLLFFSWS